MGAPARRVLAAGVAVAALALPAAGSGGSGGTDLVVFASDRAENRQPEIYAVGVDGRRRVNLSRRPATDTDPVWSPDGRRIAFLSFPGGHPSLVVANADGRSRRVLATERAVGWILGAPSWSPDGRRIAFAGGDPRARRVRVVASRAGASCDRQRLGAGVVPGWAAHRAGARRRPLDGEAGRRAARPPSAT